MEPLNTELLKLLGETFYSNGKAYFQSLTTEQQQALCPEMLTVHLCCWCYRMLHDVLPANVRNQFRTNYLYRSTKVTQQQKMKEELFALLEEKQIRFAPLKGADLAFELYQEPVLRYFCDLDILIHPEDTTRALEELTRAQWLEITQNSQNKNHHHFTVRKKQHVALEPHKTLPNFSHVPISEIWMHIHPVKPGSFQHRLEPELRLQLLLRHANNHYSESLYKILLDAAHILQSGAVNFTKSAELAAKWDMPYPGHFLAAFPDFFPPELIQQAGGSPDVAALYRKLFEHAVECSKISHHHQVASENILKLIWWKKRFSGLAPIVIRNKYQLPPRGAYLRLSAAWLGDLILKAGIFIKYVFRRNSNVKKYCSIVEKINRHE